MNKRFLGKHHTEKSKREMRLNRLKRKKELGYINSPEARKKMSISKLNEKNGQWKGNNVGYKALHSWIKRKKIKPKFCETCKKRKSYDLSNISGLYKREVDDYKYECRRCHMENDGRMEKNLRGNKKPLEKVKLICKNCNKKFEIIPSLKKVRKYCSNRCWGKFKSENKLFYGNQYIKK